MIEHIYIKNYKAFERENIPLDKNTLLIGTNNTGKTTILESLDLFFNNVINHNFVLNKNKNVIIELNIDDKRYRKVYSPPHYHLNFQKCIGDMFEINHLKYLYIPKEINTQKLLNDILTINMTKKVSKAEQSKIYKVSDYIDGILGNSKYKLFRVSTKYEMDITKKVEFNKEDFTKIISNIPYPHLIIGIDNFEDNFAIESLDSFIKYSYQTIVTTQSEKVVKDYKHYVSALYKGNQIDDLDTIKKMVHRDQNKKYLLVEGKYDVNWFEKALTLLHQKRSYTVIPCGGCGNISFVKAQLEKEGHKTVVITDGDTHSKTSLKKDIIELYADISFINKRFHTTFKVLPTHKNDFFKRFHVKNDVVKNVLSRWAKKGLTLDSDFVIEVKALLN